MSNKTPTNGHYDIIIVGAGPTGLGAAKRLAQMGHSSWALFEAENQAGGLASTDVTKEGFLADYGGHVVFSHYKYFDECLDEALPHEEDWCHHQRISYIRYKDRWVPYPFQNNLSALESEDQVKCLDGLIDATTFAKTAPKPTNFDEWIVHNLGVGIADCFMRPYTWKVWATKPTSMGCGWLGERVPAPNAKQAVTNVVRGVIQGNWGPNATFRFPSFGGTGHIWQSVAKKLPQENLHYNTRVQLFDEDCKAVILKDGRVVTYNHLISTIPLDTLVSSIKNPPADHYTICEGLFHSATNVVLIGVRGKRPDHVGSTCWYYFPENNCPFYRATVFSNYAPFNVPAASHRLPTLRLAGAAAPHDTAPAPGPYWSLLLEVSESKEKPVDKETLFGDCIKGLINTGILEDGYEIVSLYHKFCEHGYPTPSLGRDEILDSVLPALRQKGIYSRGRLGSWKYEVSNQDHSFMLGVEAVDSIKSGAVELSLLYPDVVNGRSNDERSLSTRFGSVNGTKIDESC